MRPWKKSRNTSENKKTRHRSSAYFHREDQMKQSYLLGISLPAVAACVPQPPPPPAATVAVQ
jgi:hypothetical protein